MTIPLVRNFCSGSFNTHNAHALAALPRFICVKAWDVEAMLALLPREANATLMAHKFCDKFLKFDSRIGFSGDCSVSSAVGKDLAFRFGQAIGECSGTRWNLIILLPIFNRFLFLLPK